MVTADLSSSPRALRRSSVLAESLQYGLQWFFKSLDFQFDSNGREIFEVIDKA